jgi:nicotinamidase/pyrazinamidase
MKNIEACVLAVDVQNDFCPEGSLAVKHGDEVVQPINRMFMLANDMGWKKAASRDWHPTSTAHFDAWPKHCIQETPGAEFEQRLNLRGVTVFSKGMSEKDDGYSPFEGVDQEGKTLDQFLGNARRIYIGGLATDYCVRAAVLDAIKKEYEVYLLLDAIRAVDISAGDGERAIKEMKKAGATITDTGTVFKEFNK